MEAYMLTIRRTATFITLLLLVLTAAGTAMAQSRYLEDGQSGAAISAGLGSGDGYSSLSAGLGYSFGSKFELGLGVSKSSLDDDLIGNDGSLSEISPYALATVVRPKNGSMVGLEFSAQYSKGTFSSDGLDELVWDMTSSAVGIGGNLYLKLESSPSLQVYPMVSADYITITTKIEDAYGDSVDDDTSDVSLGVGLGLLFNKKVAITPHLSTFDGETSYGVSVTLLIPGA